MAKAFPPRGTLPSKPAAAAALTQSTLTDSSGGTASTTLADVTEANNAGSADRVPVENAIASLAARLAEVEADTAALKTAVDANNAAVDSMIDLMDGSIGT